MGAPRGFGSALEGGSFGRVKRVSEGIAQRFRRSEQPRRLLRLAAGRGQRGHPRQPFGLILPIPHLLPQR